MMLQNTLSSSSILNNNILPSVSGLKYYMLKRRGIYQKLLIALSDLDFFRRVRI